MGPRRRRERSVHSSPSRSVAVCLLATSLATRTAQLRGVHVCLDLRNAVSAWVWLIHWLLGLETTGLRKLGLGL